MSSGDEARATVSVALPPDAAFRVFTEEVNLWWRRGRRFRNAPGAAGLVCIEPGPGGRLFESFDTAGGEQVVQIGRTLAWEPPRRLLLQWRASNFAPHEHTEVEVLFKPVGAGTHVTVIHRGWAAIRPDHPVRHGQPVPAFLRMMGLWWGDLLAALRLHAAGVPMAAPQNPKPP
jgi:uncharacterized protein YndB with AHSA1/START domain